MVSESLTRAIYVQGCEREVAEAGKGSSDELKNECIMRLSWALVHSRRPEDVQRGIAMLEGEIIGILFFFFWNPFILFHTLCLGIVEFHENFGKHFHLYVCPFPSSYAFYLLTPLPLPFALQFTVFTLLMLVSFLSKSSNLFCHLQLLWVAVTVPCKWGKRFIFWRLATTEVGTMQEAGSLLSAVWRFDICYSIFASIFYSPLHFDIKIWDIYLCAMKFVPLLYLGQFIFLQLDLWNPKIAYSNFVVSCNSEVLLFHWLGWVLFKFFPSLFLIILP